MNRRARARILAVGMAGVLVVTLVGGVLSATGDRTGSTDQTTGTTLLVEELPPPERHSDLPAISVVDLPPEALEMIALIAAGGPYPNRQDGGRFFNREGLLPAGGDAYYLEYTVATPGESDRGSRRLVVGGEGEVYYTDDHYESFSEVVPE